MPWAIRTASFGAWRLWPVERILGLNFPNFSVHDRGRAMFSELKRLLHPFRGGFAWYIVFTLFRQGLVLGGGYGFVLLIRSYEHRPAQSALIALGVLVGYKLLLDSVDQVMGWRFARNVSYPMFRQLSVNVNLDRKSTRLNSSHTINS